MIEQIVTKYDFSKVEWEPQLSSVSLKAHFAITFKAIPNELQCGKVVSSQILTVKVEDKSEGDSEHYIFNRKTQNYFSFKAKDGTCRVIEALLFLDSDQEPWLVGFPLTLVEQPEIEHDFTLLFDGVYFNFICDGALLDRDMPMGDLSQADLTFAISNIQDFRVATDIAKVERHKESVYKNIPIAYYTPYGFNAWLGDVVPVTYNGVFHIFYLYDRHHHKSRRGKGAHEFWHLTSSNLVDWVDHGPVQELTAQWQGFGTGTAFIYQGKLHLSFGWHTERTKSEEEMADQLFHRHLSEYGNSGEFDYNEIGDLTPSGASYLTSEDGIEFTPSNKLIHYLKNPSIFTAPDGSLSLYQEGTWSSDHLGSWKLVDKDFPPIGKNSFARNCADCPNLFALGDWEYFMIGFTGFWGRKKGASEWIDFTKEGWEPYDGGAVPMVAEYDGRMIEGSWPNGIGWGSCLLLRELIPLENGRVGKRWIEETLPKFSQNKEADKDIDLPDGATYTLIKMTVNPSIDGRFTARFSRANGGSSLYLVIDFAAKRAEWTEDPSVPLKTYREKMIEHPELDLFSKYPDTHYQCRNYAKENLLLSDDKPLSLKLMICRDEKMRSTIVDAEIDGKHTMLTHRCDFKVEKVNLSNGYAISLQW